MERCVFCRKSERDVSGITISRCCCAYDFICNDCAPKYTVATYAEVAVLEARG